MRNYIILNGNNSNTISGLLIQSLPPISKPLMRTAIEEIDGRDGDIVTNLGYSAYDKEVSIGLYGSYDVDEVIKYFNDNMTGQVTFSNEPDKYYNYEIINQIDFERLIRFKTATVTLHCQPFKYPTEETPVEIEIQNITNEAEEMDLDNTADAPMTLALKGNTSQASDPTPDSPVDINVVSGDNTIEICGKNLFDIGTDLSSWFQTYQDGIKINSNSVNRTTATISNNKLTINTYDNTGWTWLAKWVKLNKNTDYIISGTNTQAIRVVGFNSKEINTVGTLITVKGSNTQDFSFNSGEYDYYCISFFPGGANQYFENLQIEEGSTSSEYEAYTGNSQLISLGVENLFDGELELGTYTDGGVKTNSNTNYRNKNIISVKPSTIYTFSINGVSQKYGVYYYDSSKTFISAEGLTTGTLTTPNNCYYINFRCFNADFTNDWQTLKIQLEKGSKANSYSEYGKTPIELCSSSDGTKKDGLIYDLSTDKLYKYSEIGKVVLDGSENWYTNGTAFQCTFSGNKYITPNTDVFSNYFVSVAYSGSTFGISLSQVDNTSYGRIVKGADNFSSLSDFKTWLSTHNPIVYYVLATPTTIEIDNDKLKQQVKALYQNAKSCDPITHITQNANDKPFMLNATAVQKGTDTATVDNDGNIYSKPTLDIEGNGIVAIYLNGNQMFSVDLSNSSECIIDVTNLEAYDPETNELMNRQVTGDYSKFILPVGENQVKVSGNVTKTTISDYVRWL